MNFEGFNVSVQALQLLLLLLHKLLAVSSNLSLKPLNVCNCPALALLQCSL